jgi:hypothetical protein
MPKNDLVGARDSQPLVVLLILSSISFGPAMLMILSLRVGEE